MSEHVKLLGLTISSDFKWNVPEVVTKAASRLDLTMFPIQLSVSVRPVELQRSLSKNDGVGYENVS